MGGVDAPEVHFPADQQRIRAKCFHRKGKFIPFEWEAIEQSIPARFEQITSRYPDRLAVRMGNQALSYDELNQGANRIAYEIQGRQGKRQVPVVLLMDHGIQMIAAILGVLKSGNSYVPFETTYPQARLASMLEDVQASLIVTNTQQEKLACALATEHTSVLNMDHIAVSGFSANPAVRVSPEALAYILYTSGSTGQPKGVYQNHRNVLHMVMRYTNNYHVCPDDRIALLRSFGTNGGVLHTFGALFNGASVFPFDLKRSGVNELSRWLSQEEITLCSMGPTTFRQLAVFLRGDASFPELRALNLSGEPAYRRDIEMGLEHFSKDCVFVNTWGATEASSATQYFMDRETEISRSVVPVGYAVPDMMISVCDENGQEVGANQIGEIRVSSRYLSLGYWRRPDLTRERFSSSPQGGDTRIYHTGDLGYMLPDRCLVHLGRQDFQVKVRGFRVEIAEVEGGLLEVDNVQEAIVIVREDQPDNQRLVAYIVPRSHPAPTNTELRRALAKTLPVHMIPSAFVVLDKLPCLPSGKIDRSALPEPGTARPALETPFVAPHLPIEEELVKVWAEVLHLDQVGIHDNFFEMGGHSLLAMQILSIINKTFHSDLPVQMFFEAPTVAEMAAAITRHLAAVTDPDIVALLLEEIEASSQEKIHPELAAEHR